MKIRARLIKINQKNHQIKPKICEKNLESANFDILGGQGWS